MTYLVSAMSSKNYEVGGGAYLVEKSLRNVKVCVIGSCEGMTALKKLFQLL